MLGKIFSGGAADLVKSVGGVIDNLHTSKEEKLEAEDWDGKKHHVSLGGRFKVRLMVKQKC